MTPEQKQRIKNLVQQDCEIRFAYIQDGKTCAIGKLLKEAGFDVESLCQNDTIHSIGTALSALEQHYGLTKKQAMDIQFANDLIPKFQEDPIEDRRARVLDVVESFTAETAVSPSQGNETP